MKNFIIYCENREQFYSITNRNNVTHWTKKIADAFIFNTQQDANNLIKDFKNSAMNDTKYISVYKKTLTITRLKNKTI